MCRCQDITNQRISVVNHLLLFQTWHSQLSQTRKTYHMQKQRRPNSKLKFFLSWYWNNSTFLFPIFGFCFVAKLFLQRTYHFVFHIIATLCAIFYIIYGWNKMGNWIIFPIGSLLYSHCPCACRELCTCLQDNRYLNEKLEIAGS